MGDSNPSQQSSSSISNNNQTTPSQLNFDQALAWAEKDVKQKRYAGTWDAKFVYIIIGIILVIIILGLLYIYYSKAERMASQNDYKLIDSIKQAENCLAPEVNSPSPFFNNSYRPSAYGTVAPVSNINQINSPGGTLMPAMQNGRQTGWLLYPNRG